MPVHVFFLFNPRHRRRTLQYTVDRLYITWSDLVIMDLHQILKKKIHVTNPRLLVHYGLLFFLFLVVRMNESSNVLLSIVVFFKLLHCLAVSSIDALA